MKGEKKTDVSAGAAATQEAIILKVKRANKSMKKKIAVDSSVESEKIVSASIENKISRKREFSADSEAVSKNSVPPKKVKKSKKSDVKIANNGDIIGDDIAPSGPASKIKSHRSKEAYQRRREKIRNKNKAKKATARGEKVDAGNVNDRKSDDSAGDEDDSDN